MIDKNEKIWVPARADRGSVYVPMYTEKWSLYKGKDALPDFKTEKECLIWCQHHGYRAGKVFKRKKILHKKEIY